MTAERVFDFDEKAAARIVGVAPRTLRRWRKDGKVSYCETPGGRIRYTLDQLMALRQAGRVAATVRPCPPLDAQG